MCNYLKNLCLQKYKRRKQFKPTVNLVALNLELVMSLLSGEDMGGSDLHILDTRPSQGNKGILIY